MTEKRLLINNMDVAEKVVERLRLEDFIILSYGGVFNSEQFELIYINKYDEVTIRTDNEEIYKYVLRNAPTRRKD